MGPPDSVRSYISGTVLTVSLPPILHVLQIERQRFEIDAEVYGLDLHARAGAELRRGEVEDGVEADVGEGVVDGLGGFGGDGDDADVDLVLTHDCGELI